MKFPVPDGFAPDARKSLHVLKGEWKGCTRCQLGEKREERLERMAFGEGTPDAPIMLIGDSPGADEALTGSISRGTENQTVLSVLLRELKLEQLVYRTNLVLCRSASPITDAEGRVMYWTDRKTGKDTPRFRDETPPYPCQAACAERLYQEIYSVDPLVIVMMGRTVSEFLVQSSVPVHLDNEPRVIHIPGRASRAVLTEKKQEWRRVKKGVVTYPVERNTVQYLAIPTNNLPFVYIHINETHSDAPFQRLGRVLMLARALVVKYRQEALGKDM